MISLSMITLKATGSVLFERQWLGRAEQTTEGLPVRTSSPGWSFITSFSSRSPGHRKSLLPLVPFAPVVVVVVPLLVPLVLVVSLILPPLPLDPLPALPPPPPLLPTPLVLLLLSTLLLEEEVEEGGEREEVEVCEESREADVLRPLPPPTMLSGCGARWW